MVDKEAPDVIAFQEVLESKADLGFFPSLTEFSKDIRFHHQYFSPFYEFHFMKSNAECGNAVVSNLTLSNPKTVFTNLEHKKNFSLDHDDYTVRNFQHVTVQDQNGKDIHIINHHGYHVPEHKNGNEFTTKACQQIVDYALKLEGAVIIAGDFNLVPNSESVALINQHFRNLTTEYDLKTTRTDLTRKVEPCDYIFVSKDITVKDFYASPVVASDHQGLVLDFEV